jgi:hypothetical protein
MGGGVATSSSKKAEIKVCVCGVADPQYRGYCHDCFKALNDRFKLYLERFRQVSDEYDQYASQDTKAADEKLRIMKNKIE